MSISFGITYGKPYVAAKLLKQDEEGFPAAGFLLWKRESDNVQVLMAREVRNGRNLLNFLDGKRLKKEDSAIDAAINQAHVKTGEQLSPEALEGMKHPPLVLWSGDGSKYALFLFEVTSSHDRQVDVLAARSGHKEVRELEWVSRKDLKKRSFFDAHLHCYATIMVKELSDPEHADVLGNIEELFETAKMAGEASKIKKDETADDAVAAAITAKLSELSTK